MCVGGGGGGCVWVCGGVYVEGSVPVAIVGLEPGTSGSVVQRFNHLATKQPSGHQATPCE